MKKLFFLILCFILNISMLSAKTLIADNVVAIVNNKVILNSDVEKEFFLLGETDQNIKIPFKTDFFRNKLIQKLIIEDLMLQAADQMHVNISEEQIRNFMIETAKKQNITLDQLQKNIILYTSKGNFNYHDYINHIIKLLKIKTAQEYALNERVFVSENEVNTLLNRLLIDHNRMKKINVSIIFSPFYKKNNLNNMQLQKNFMNKIVKKLKKGYNFNDIYEKNKDNKNISLLAKTFWTRALNIQKMFVNISHIYKKRQILGPLKHKNGLYIIKINDIEKNKNSIKTEFYVQKCFLNSSVIPNKLELQKNIFNIYNDLKKEIYSFDYAMHHVCHVGANSININNDFKQISNTSLSRHEKNILKNLHENEITLPIKYNLGWYIIQLQKKDTVNEFLQKEMDKAYNIIFYKKMLLEKEKWINDLQKTSYIQIFSEN